MWGRKMKSEKEERGRKEDRHTDRRIYLKKTKTA